MKKIILLFVAACCIMAASAQTNFIRVSKVNYSDALSKAIPPSFGGAGGWGEILPSFGGVGGGSKPAAPAKANQTLITPKGDCRAYLMSAVVRDISGMVPVIDVANKVYSDEGGKVLYFGSLFPAVIRCDELWAKAVVKDGFAEIDCADALYNLEIVDAQGVIEESAELHVGELLVDEREQPYGLQNVQFTKDGDHYYIDYSSGMRPIVLFAVTGDDMVTVYSTTYNHDLRPYTGNTTFNVVPDDATISEYIYGGQDAAGKEFSIKGRVAVSGNDYYFDNLLPEAGHAWIKGTRSGNTITLPNDQYLGTEISYYLYYNGFKTTGFDSSTGQYKGDKVELTFNVDSKGVITLNNPSRTFPCAFYKSGNQFYATFQNRIEPFLGDIVARPSDPYDLKLVTKYFAAYGENSISFCLDNISTEGSYIDPANLYYCMYLDEERYTFNRSLYPYIHEQQMTLFPYGYKDKENYDIYLADDGRNVICFREDLFVQCGIQAVYILDGKEYVSNIVYIDEKGNVEVVDPLEGEPDGISSTSPDPSEGGESRFSARTYDLSGRRVLPSFGGVGGGLGGGCYIKGGRVILNPNVK